jgi:hypothetical protein
VGVPPVPATRKPSRPSLRSILQQVIGKNGNEAA